MTHESSGRPASSPARDSSLDALVRLTPFGWSGGLLVIVVTLALSFFLLGYFLVYWRTADMDFMVVYNALIMNAGRPQEFFDHPSYYTILSVKIWFQFLHALGLLKVHTIADVPADPAGFDAAMTSAIRAARIVAWLTATAAILIFAGLMRAIVRDWRVALLAAYAFAFSGGMAFHIRVLRSEMIAAAFAVFALMALILAARRANTWRPLVVGGAALLCMLAMENKVSAILVVAALPVLALAFGTTESTSAGLWRNTRPAWIITLVTAVVAALLAFAATPLVTTGLDPAAVAQSGMHPFLADRYGIYQSALAVFTLLCMIAFAGLWKISFAETLTSIFAAVAGISLGLLALDIIYDVNNVTTVINPIERMLMYAALPGAQGGSLGGGLIKVILMNAGGMLARYSYVFAASPRPAVFLVWLVVPGIIYALRKGEHQTALQAALLMLTAFGVDTLGNQRGFGLPTTYYVFTDPLTILAGALLLARLTDLRFRKWAYPTGATLLVVHFFYSQAEPVKRAFSKRGNEEICEWNQSMVPRLPIYWCANLPEKHRL
jgi:hypothetical protein